MFRQASSRNHRSKGLKIKHVLQIFLLLAVCIWLLYQVKHSHDKRKALDENNAKAAYKITTNRETLKFGRKDVPPGIEKASESEKHVEDEENEEEVETKRDEDMDAKQDGGDDEVDEHDREKDENETEHLQDSSDEQKKTSEAEDEEKEENEKAGQNEEVDPLENHDLDGGDQTQEAREVHYRADDASSAVLRNNQMIGHEAENEHLNDSDGEHIHNIMKNDLENYQKTNVTEDVASFQNDSDLHSGEVPVMDDGQTTGNRPSTNATNNVNVLELSTSKFGNESRSSLTTVSSDHMASHDNSTENDAEAPPVYLNNATTIWIPTQDQNATVKVITSEQEKPNSETKVPEQSMVSNMSLAVENLQTTAVDQSGNSNSTIVAQESQSVLPKQNSSTETSHENELQQGQILHADAMEQMPTLDKLTDTSNETTITVISQNIVSEKAASVEKFQIDNSQQINMSNTALGVEESHNSETSLSAGENAEVVQNDINNSSTNLVTQEEKDALTDLSTLPQIESEGRNSEIAAE